jgi:chromosome segregation ATPase
MAYRSKTRKRRTTQHSPFASRNARIAELEQRVNDLDATATALRGNINEIERKRDEEVNAAIEQANEANANAKRWHEQAQRVEKVMLGRVEEAQKDDERKQREIRFLRDAIYRIASGDQVEQTFRVLG